MEEANPETIEAILAEAPIKIITSQNRIIMINQNLQGKEVRITSEEARKGLIERRFDVSIAIR